METTASSEAAANAGAQSDFAQVRDASDEKPRPGKHKPLILGDVLQAFKDLAR